jgi:SET domain-containing protein
MYNRKLVKRQLGANFFGVFAEDDIEQGEIIFCNWNDSCVRLSRKEVEGLPEPYKTIFEKYSTEIEELLYVGPFEFEDLSNQLEYFINHSCNPNTWMVNDDDVAARRFIRKGEQVTIDYATLIVNEFASSKIKKCLCGSSSCRGKLGKDDWWLMKDVYRGHFLSWIEEKIPARENADRMKSIL